MQYSWSVLDFKWVHSRGSTPSSQNSHWLQNLADGYRLQGHLTTMLWKKFQIYFPQWNPLVHVHVRTCITLHYLMQSRRWQPAPDNKVRGVVVWPEPEVMDITITLYKVTHMYVRTHSFTGNNFSGFSGASLLHDCFSKIERCSNYKCCVMCHRVT